MTRRTEQRDDGILYATAGATRWGKSYSVQRRVKDAKRLICWDIRAEMNSQNCEIIETIPALAARVLEVWDQPARLAYWGSTADFDKWCQIAYLFGMIWPATIYAEELSDVTHAGKAPAGWGELIRRGLFYGNHIYANTQRPAETDKTVWGNAPVIRTFGGFTLPADRARMAGYLGIQPEVIESLNKYQWIERKPGDTTVTRGGPDDL